MKHPRTGFLFLLLAFLATMACTLQTHGLMGEPDGGISSEGGSQDVTAPTISFTAPADAATGMAVGTKINVVFSEAMSPSTLTEATFTLTNGGVPVAGAVTYSGVAATFTPVIALAFGALYTATITTGVDDLAHNALAADHIWSFTTSDVADTTPPTVSATSPTNGAVDVAADAEISATFSETMDSLTVTDATFSVTREGVPVSGAVTCVGGTATFAPESALALDAAFLATVSTGVTDLAGNALATQSTWMFTTAARPTVTSTDPENGALGVAVNTPLHVTFSVEMAPATITAATFLVKRGMTPVSGVVTYLGKTATFTPSIDYWPNAVLTATITIGARDLSNNALGADHVWSFQTGTKASAAPVALGLASTFAVLAFDTIANTISVGTLVTGDIGISPGASLTGFPPGIILGGTYTGAAATGAQVDLLAAYNEVAGRPGADALPADLAGLTFTPGLYRQGSAVALSTGSCTLDAQGDENALFIFQIGTAFGLAASTQVILIGGAKATNIYWAVGASATLGASAKLKGTLLAATAITLGAGAQVDGRLLAHGGSVTLDTDVITVPPS